MKKSPIHFSVAALVLCLGLTSDAFAQGKQNLSAVSKLVQSSDAKSRVSFDARSQSSMDAKSQVSIDTKIVRTSEACLGKQMWKGYGLKTGYLGCAAAVSNVLKDAGINAAHSAAVVVIRNQLLASKNAKEIVVRNGPSEELLDSKLLKLARPGDVVLAFAKPPEKNFNGGGNAHCGILSSTTKICTNDWNDGVWKKLDIHQMFDYYPYLRIVRLDRTSAK